MRKNRASYHYAIRRVKRNAHNIINERFANAIVDNKDRNFWSEVKRLRKK